MEWSDGGKWDNCNSIINKYILKKKAIGIIIKDYRNMVTNIKCYIWSDSGVSKSWIFRTSGEYKYG